MSKPPIVWTIAGFDPSSGAGITADLKTISSLDCYGVACITALTVQNTRGVRRVEAVSPATVRETLAVLLEDLPPNAIKIGMLGTAGTASVVADFLSEFLAGSPDMPPHAPCPVVLDPILRSSSGAALLDRPGMDVLVTRLLPLCMVITPNREEAALITGVPATDAEGAARALRQLGASAAVVTGGDPLASTTHSAEDSGDSGGEPCAEDVIAYGMQGMELVETLSAPRIRSTSTHGTGCAFSSAIACALARGQSIPAAVTGAKAFVRRAIEHAPGLGHGRGPMGLDRAKQ